MAYHILVINPGSTSTKVAVYQDEQALFTVNNVHESAELNACVDMPGQLALRLASVEAALRRQHIEPASLSGVVGRGGMLPHLQTGGYYINQPMKDIISSGRLIPHASNLGALLADRLAAPYAVPAIIYDGVAADDLPEIAKITGIPEIRRESFCHVLNSRAMGRKYAQSQGKKYEQMRLLVAHLGGGVSISAHEQGRIIDIITDDGGPFSPERAGSLPLHYIVDMCFSGKYTKQEVIKKQRGYGGLKALLGTADCQEIECMIANGDQHAALVYEAQAYQIAKGIGNLAPALSCRIDAIILTGGVAHSQLLTGKIKAYVESLAPIVTLPGEMEMEALAMGMLRILRGEEKAREYQIPSAGA